MNHLSLEMCQKLSSLAPGFEGHWDWCGRYDSDDKLIGEPFVQCEEITSIDGPREWDAPVIRIICPAWQVEDVLRNWFSILEKYPQAVGGVGEITLLLVGGGDFAYQKIKKYL